MSALRVIYQDDGHQPETHDGEGARVVLEVGSFFLPHRDALLHLRTRERGSDSCGRGLLALVAVRRHTAAAMTAPVTWQLWAWTAAAGRTSCVLKGRQNALFGAGRGRKVYQDRFSGSKKTFFGNLPRFSYSLHENGRCNCTPVISV